MKKHQLIFALLLILIPFSMFANPNMQSAKLLEHKKMEFSFGLLQSSDFFILIANPLDNTNFNKDFYAGLPFSSTTSLSLSGNLTSAFNLRAGINEWVEYQFQGGISNRFYFLPFIAYFTLFVPNFEVYAETGAKIKLFKGTKYNGSLLAKAGIEFVIEPLLNFPRVTPVSTPYSTKITFEVTPLFDITPKKPDSHVTCYFGFPTRLEYSLFEINHSGNVGLAENRRSFPNLSVKFLFGIESTKHKVITRSEFFLQYTINAYSTFNGKIEDNIFSNSWDVCGTEHIFSMGYSLSLGGRTN